MERQPHDQIDSPATDNAPEIQPFRNLVAASLVWDSHAGVFPDPDDNLSALQSWYRAGVNYISFNVGFDVVDWQTTLQTLLAYRRRLRELSGSVTQIGSVDNILAARKEGKLAVSFDIEGANALNGDAAMVSAYFELGVRQMLLTYNLGNAAAGGCHDENTGLTGFGREVVAEMNRVGMIVDCSHAAHHTTLDMMEASTAPVVFTHSNPTARCAHGRNIMDDQIRLCADTGGVVGINGMGIFLGDNDNSDETFADHVCYVADLVGAKHVGVGLDYKPASGSSDALGAILRARPDYWPLAERYGTKNIKLVSPGQLPGICRILSRRGWSQDDLRGFLGENFLRVARAVWP